MTRKQRRKRFGFRVRYLLKRLRHPNLPTILFFPERPRLHASVFKVCHLSGYRIALPGDRFDLAYYWLDATFRPEIPPDDPRFSEVRIINGRCLDISKARVEEAHQRVFGYGISVDPLIHAGPLVIKSDLNAQHNGVIVQGPLLEVVPGNVYQRVIQNIEPNDHVVDHRVVFIDGRIPHIYLKFRPMSRRFISNRNDRVEMVETDSVFTADEQEKLVAIARDLHLDVGDLDVLRDRSDGRIYVVDINNTPNGPATRLPPAQMARALKNLTIEFDVLVRRWTEKRPPQAQG